MVLKASMLIDWNMYGALMSFLVDKLTE